jgi:hypothetical protein
MGRFTRAEIETAFAAYTATVDRCTSSGDWSPFADLFVEDVTYIEHAYGVMRGREQVRDWIVEVMAPFPHMRFPHDWVAFDEENDALVVGIRNVLDHPTEPGISFGFPNVTRLVYGGNGLFASEEDVYNPRRDAAEVVGAWLEAGGQMVREPSVQMKHG